MRSEREKLLDISEGIESIEQYSSQGHRLDYLRQPAVHGIMSLAWQR